MVTQMIALSDAGYVLSSLNGWEIGGIVVALIVVAGVVWMLPELIRYMKIRHM